MPQKMIDSPEISSQSSEGSEWISSNRGALSRIAKRLNNRPERFAGKPMSAEFVSMVLKGTRVSKDGRVERALRKAGAPVPPRKKH